MQGKTWYHEMEIKYPPNTHRILLSSVFFYAIKRVSRARRCNKCPRQAIIPFLPLTKIVGGFFIMYNANQFMPYGRQPYYVPSYQQPITDTVFSDVRILTIDQIKGFIPPINSRVLLIDKNNGIAYVKTTDNIGNMFTDKYTFVPLKDEQKKDVKEEEKLDFSKFATKDDIASIRKELELLRKPSVSVPVKETITK